MNRLGALLSLLLTGCADSDWVLARWVPSDNDPYCLYGEIEAPYRVTLGDEPEGPDGAWSWAVAPPGGAIYVWAPGDYELAGFWTPDFYENPPWYGLEYVKEGCGLTGVVP